MDTTSYSHGCNSQGPNRWPCLRHHKPLPVPHSGARPQGDAVPYAVEHNPTPVPVFYQLRLARSVPDASATF